MSFSPFIPVSRPYAGTWLVAATAKDRLGIPVSETRFDVQIADLIVAAKESFEGPEGLGRSIFRSSYKEVSPIVENSWSPSAWPVVNVTSIKDSDELTTVTATTCDVVGNRQNLVRFTGAGGSYIVGYETSPLYMFAYDAGFVSQGDISGWVADTAYSVGDIVQPTDPTERFVYRVTTAGTSDSTEPTWTVATIGTEVTDGTVTYIATLEYELPKIILEAGYATVVDWFRGGLELPAGISSETTPGGSFIYKYYGGSLPPIARNALRSWR